jgi:hypothetical protein
MSPITSMASKADENEHGDQIGCEAKLIFQLCDIEISIGVHRFPRNRHAECREIDFSRKWSLQIGAIV